MIDGQNPYEVSN